MFEWLHPGPESYERDNDSSCVLLVRTAATSAILTGDIEARAEGDLLEHARPGPVDVVVAPHHGSRTSSTPMFVDVTRPQWIVYAVGYRNRWHFPAPRVVARWSGAGAQALRTDTGGAITIDLGPGPIVGPPGRWRVDHPRIWRDP
jgi:competence protein ComEC